MTHQPQISLTTRPHQAPHKGYINPILPPRSLHSIAPPPSPPPTPRSSSSASPVPPPPVLPSSSAAGGHEVVLVTGVWRPSDQSSNCGFGPRKEGLRLPDHQQPASRSLPRSPRRPRATSPPPSSRGLRRPPPMSTPASRARAIGFIIILVSANAGIHSANGGLTLLLGFTGVLAGANLVAVAVRAADGPALAVPAVSDGARALAAFVRRNVAIVGLVMASCAFITPVSSDAGPVLCFAMFSLLLLRFTLINLGVRGE